LLYEQGKLSLSKSLTKEEFNQMLGKQMVRKSTTLLLTMAIFCVSSMVALAGTKEATGEITITGQVSINGQTAVSHSTIVSGSTIVTSADSSAIINLGKSGRIEILDKSSLTLKFTENSITGMLSSGNIRVANAAGIGTTFTTSNSTVISDSAQANTFSIGVDCADSANCSETFVETVSGLVTLRKGSMDRQIAAGTDSAEGNPAQQRRPSATTPVSGISRGALTLIFILVGAGVIAAIFFAKRKKAFDDVGGGPVLVPSLIR
jgi:hypothetical protein